MLKVGLLLALLAAPSFAADGVSDLARGMREARRDGRPADAIALLEGKPAAWMNDTRVAGERIQALLDLLRLDEARSVNASMGELKQAALPFFIGRTRLQLMGSDPAPILEAVDGLLVGRPGHPDLLALRVHALGALERWSEAFAQVEVLSGDVPTPMRTRLRADVMLAKARAHIALPDQVERGIPLLEQALALQPERIDVRCDLAMALAQWHRAERAEQLVREVLDEAEGRDKCELVFALGMVYRAVLRDADAQDCFAKVLADDPDHPRAAAALAGCWLREGRTDEAREVLDRSLERDPADLRALFVLAELEMTVGAPDRSEQALQRILERNPDSLKALYMLSRALAMQGEVERQQEVLASYAERQRRLASR
jgi:tetratricopeptide (TPR) repeat protein